MTKLKSLNYDKTQKLKLWQNKNKIKKKVLAKLTKFSNCDQTHKSYCDKTKKKSNCDKTPKLKLWQ